MTAPSNRLCECCTFYEPTKSEHGQCRRHPPRGNTEPEEDPIWPIVFCENWCGEFLKQNKPAKRSTDLPLSDQSCERCKFFMPSASGLPDGTCNRHPPVISNTGERWPGVSGFEWCGEFVQLQKEGDE